MSTPTLMRGVAVELPQQVTVWEAVADVLGEELLCRDCGAAEPAAPCSCTPTAATAQEELPL